MMNCKLDTTETDGDIKNRGKEKNQKYKKMAKERVFCQKHILCRESDLHEYGL